MLTAAVLAVHGNGQGCPWKALDLLLVHRATVLGHIMRFS